MRIAIAVFDRAEELDFVGPWEVLAFWARSVRRNGADGADVQVTLVGPSLEPVTCAKGLRVVPDATLHDLDSIDVFVLPGGEGTRALIGPDEPLHVGLRGLASSGTLLTSVCTGSLVYAAAGLLKGRPATTHWAAFDELLALDPSIQARRDERYVDDGDIVTAAGVSAGIDVALHLVRRLGSADEARAVRRGIQYDPQPPV